MENLLSGALASPFDAERIPGRDLFAVAKFLRPIDAHLIRNCLAAAGIPAVVADANHVQADQLIAPALGGVRVLVPAAHLQQAAEVLAAFERGELALDDDSELDGAGEDDPA